jgi:hypothetical protein
MAKYIIRMNNVHRYVNTDTLQTVYNFRSIRRIQIEHNEHLRIEQSAITVCYITNRNMNAKFIVHTT